MIQELAPKKGIPTSPILWENTIVNYLPENIKLHTMASKSNYHEN